MRGVYEIAGIAIDFTFQYPDYFEEKIEAYITTSLPKYKMEVLIDDFFVIPSTNPSVIYKNRKIYYLDSITVITVFKEEINAYSHLITYSNDYSNIVIQLNPHLKSKLPELEYLLSGVFFYEIALKEGLITLHASAINDENKAILFSAPSQTGKSTLTNYFLSQYPEASIINDDKPLIKHEDGLFYVYGSPWSGKDVLNSNTKVLLAGIFFLAQGKENVLQSLSRKEKIQELFRNIYRPREESLVDNASETISLLIEKTNIMKYSFQKHPTSAKIIHDFLGGNHQ